MITVFPDYYKDFSCIAEKCRHNCCIGWEIDIDEDTLAFYQSVDGEIGRRLQENISLTDTPHFILGHHDRCPFLNERNLCDLILTLGENRLCQICTDHPRFRNELPDRTEIGVGLCCEAAGRLILGRQAPAKLEGSEPTDDEIILIRDEALALLQNRSLPITKRIGQMLSLCGASLGARTIPQWADLLLSLERLEEDWTSLLTLLKDRRTDVDDSGFDAHMKNRQTEYEQFLVYLVYRHLANAADEVDLAARAAFAALGYAVIYSLGAILWTRNGCFTFDDQVELARHFSAELEYSEENLNAIFDALV